ncbi:YeeE/YedE thiosulfate transporter family protein [Pseudomonas sp. 30_B]|uniref:YeeE/YedE thiosulfate transporter family protein n=1 Tax=Pseudomonas sp. 30_B TaxID=2813575 RepID=UPI001A9FC5B8|nr:YeeE/YedE thiosulfate transporter family protein [Pseudomonas sp. 30_B]
MPTLLPSLTLALLMGFAIQRGGTCLVAAIEEVLHKRRWTRFAALLEATLWVTAGLVALRSLGLLQQVPMGIPLHWSAVAGGVLLGLGAALNGGCVLGTLARLGSGQWAWLATPLGFLGGCLLLRSWEAGMESQPMPLSSWLWNLPATLPALVLLPLALRAGWLVHGARRLGSAPWPAHLATLVIAMCFLGLFVTVGPWNYTDLLNELADGRFMHLGIRGLLLPTLFVGALLGGWLSGNWQRRWPHGPDIVRCLAGGLLMGAGARLVPGGNDSLILFGMPLLWPNAWVAFGFMCLSIVLALRLMQWMK